MTITDDAPRVMSTDAPDDETVALRELATCLAPMLRQVSPTYREAVILADLEGITVVVARRHQVSVVEGHLLCPGRRASTGVLEQVARPDPLGARREREDPEPLQRLAGVAVASRLRIVPIPSLHHEILSKKTGRQQPQKQCK